MPIPRARAESVEKSLYLLVFIVTGWVEDRRRCCFPLQVWDEAPDCRGCTPSPMGLPGHSEGSCGPKWREGVTLLEAGGLC